MVKLIKADFDGHLMQFSDWQAMNNSQQTAWLEENAAASPMSKAKRGMICAVGINDAPYMTQQTIERKAIVCPAYRDWRSMIERAYSHKLHSRHPTYLGVAVNKEWHSFMAFREWWMLNQIDGYVLDKDILSDTREYGPSSCIFIPAWLNLFITDSGASRGEWPAGVSLYKPTERFLSQCRNQISGKRENLGYFDNPEMAHAAWKIRKLEIAKELKEEMDGIDYRIYPRITEIIENIK